VTRHRHPRPARHAALLLAALPLLASADFQLESLQPESRSTGFAATLAFTPRSATPDAVRREILDIGGGEVVVLEGPHPDLSVESALLGVPGLARWNPAEWRVRVLDSTGGERPDLAAGIVLEPFVFGALPGVRVTAGAGAFVNGARYRIEVTGPPSTELPPPHLSLDPESPAARVLARTVLNGNVITELPHAVPTLDGRRAAPAPTYTGDWRAEYASGGLLRIPLAGSGATAPGQTRVVHHGDVLPLLAVGTDEVVVHAPWRDDPGSATDSVFLTVDTGAGAPLAATRPAFPTLSPMGVEVAIDRARTFDYNLRYERLMPKTSDKFVFNRASIPEVPAQSQFAVNDYTLSLHDRLTTTTVGVRIEVYGYNQWVALNPDHYADFSVDGEALPRAIWEGRVLREVGETISLPAIPWPAEVTLRHAIVPDSPIALAGADQQNLDLVELSWRGFPRIDPGTGATTLALAASGDSLPRRVTVGGFPPGTTTGDIRVVDVSDPLAPVAVTGAPTFTDSDGTVAVEFEVGAAAARLEVALDASVASPVEVVATERLPDATALGGVLRAVYVRTPGLAGALAPLVAAQDGDILEFTPQAAYNAFNGGQASPHAVRDALAHLIAAAPARLPFPRVTLVGHGTLDPLNHLGNLPATHIPCFIELGVESGSGRLDNSEDLPYAFLFGGDSLPDIELGRIPAEDASELAVAVDRLLRHAALVDDLVAANRPALFATDDDATFLADSPVFAGIWESTGRTAQRIDLAGSSDGSAERAQTIDALGQGDGVAFSLYTGHGNTDRWAGEGIMRSTDVPLADTEERWPFVTTFTCLNGYYAFPVPDGKSLSETWLFTPDRGAHSNVAPVSVDFYLEQRLLILELLGTLTQPEPGRPRTVGEAWLATTASYITKYPTLLKTAREYILFGDPSAHLALDPTTNATVPDWRAW
jgi:hypothetical protein